MDFDFQPDFAAWVDRESGDLPQLVEDLTELFWSTRPPPGHPDERADIVITAEEIIGEIKQSQTDIFGRLTTRYFIKDKTVLGLTGDKLQSVLKFSEKLYQRKEIQNVLSEHTIREIILNWVGAVVRDQTTESITSMIRKRIRDANRLLVWIPIEETAIQGELLFADATLKMVSLKELDHQIEAGFKNAPAEQLRMMKENLHRHWLGKAAMCFLIEAEPARARELALEKAETYMALLQFFGQAPIILGLTSYAAPSGTRPRQMYRSIAFRDLALVNVSEGVTGATTSLQFTAEYQPLMQNMGLSILSSLCLRATSDYEKALLTSLLLYGRACYQLDPIDKLLQIITSLEMFTLRNEGEPITTMVADRIALVVTNGVEQRQAVVRNFKNVYSIRSGRTHHGRTILETQQIEEFLQNVWRFFLIAIAQTQRFKARLEFLDHIDRMKYS